MNVFQSVVLWVIFVVVVSFLMVGCTGYDYKLDTINYKVNSYGYLSDYEHGEHGIKLMSPTQPGDCEDHAYTKCRMIKEQYPEIETYFLSRKAGAGGVAHAALAANGFVLDNQSPLLYPYIKADWSHSSYWLCLGDGF